MLASDLGLICGRHRQRMLLVATVLLTPVGALLAARCLNLRLVTNGWLALAMAIVMGPLVEEFILRQLVQRGIANECRARGMGQRLSELSAAAMATLLFALMHLDKFNLHSAWRCTLWLVPGVVLSWIWLRRSRWTDCFWMHAYFNAALWLASVGSAGHGA
jgi:membrane protease YdiL (CAAX protease family)